MGESFELKHEALIMKQIHKLFHLNSYELIIFYLKYIDERAVLSSEDEQRVAMLYYSLYQKAPSEYGYTTMVEALGVLLQESWIREEIKAVLHVCLENIHAVEKQSTFDFPCALRVHAQYTTDQIMASFGYFNNDKKPIFREGVKHFPELKTDIFFITLNKSDKDFSMSTQYDDYAISDELFHWQSQGRVSSTSPTAQRYIHHRKNDHKIALFIRENKIKEGYTSPFTFVGTADYVRHSGDNPVSFEWKLHEKLPASLIVEANKNIL